MTDGAPRPRHRDPAIPQPRDRRLCLSYSPSHPRGGADIEYAKAQGEKLWRPTSKGEKEKKEAWDKENKPEEPDTPDEGADDEEGEGDEEEKDEL